MSEYDALKHRLAQGWNTWNTRSVLSHVRLPEGAALNLAIKNYAGRGYLKEALIGRRGAGDEKIHPGLRSYDGSYTELNLRWQGLEFLIQSATEGDDQVVLVTPRTSQRRPALLIVEAGLLWGRPGTLGREGDALVIACPGCTVRAHATAPSVTEPYVAAQTPYLALALDGPTGVSTGRRRSVDEIAAIVTRRRAEQATRVEAHGDLAEAYAAIQTCMAWDTVYDPANDRVISPVSRIWNVNWGGWVLFDWDTYFAAYMAAIDNPDLAYANAIEITREATERGFVPNFSTTDGVKSRDRSQPPVGSMVILALYRRYGDRWLLDETYDTLLAWNRWWPEHRAWDGLLCWGSDPYEPVVDAHYEVHSVGDWQGAAFESGLDNSPMYDEVPFDEERHLTALQDVGLNGLYIMDCEALAGIARILGRAADAEELTQRAEAYRGRMDTLWDNTTGLYLNRRADTGEFTHRLSPTHFYPLLGQVPTQAQAQRMVNEHLYNPNEFWGEWVLPAIERRDPAYPDQDYWRGRIWAPMNFLVYLGLRNYDLPHARRDLAAKSLALLLKEWRANGHVHENYNGDTGEGCDIASSDHFYHWGALLGLIAFMEQGKI